MAMDDQEFWDEVFLTYARLDSPAAEAARYANSALAARLEALRGPTKHRDTESRYTITRECSVEEAKHGE